MARILTFALFIALPTLLLSCNKASEDREGIAPDLSGDGQIVVAIEELFAPLIDEDLISGAIQISRNGESVYTSEFGLADRETGHPASQSTRFRIASVSKSLTAVAVLQLVENDVISLDDPLDKWIPGFRFGDQITVEQLLAHRSGIPSDVYLPEFGEKITAGITLNEAVDWVRSAEPRFRPGERFEYSNSGYLLLSAIIEKATGEPYEAVMSKNIFLPAGMTDSGLDNSSTNQAQHATGYSQTVIGKTVETAYRHPSYGWGYGALYSSPNDLSRFAHALFDGELLGGTLIESMVTGRSETPWKNQYGLGWFVSTVDGSTIVEGLGSTGGFVATIRHFPESKTTIVVTLNRDFLLYDRLFDQLDAIVLGNEWSHVLQRDAVEAPGALASFAGNYVMDDGAVLRLSDSDGVVTFGDASSADHFEVYVLSAGKGYVPSQNALLRFKKVDDGPDQLYALFGSYAWIGYREE